MQGSENRSQTPPQGGVVIPPQTVAQSNATKAARKKTMAQLPVYRAACNLLYVIVIITKRCPKSIRKFTDQIIYDCTELIKAIGMADTSREVEMRVHYINTALVLINSIRTYIKVLELTDVLVKVRHPEPDPGKFQPVSHGLMFVGTYIKPSRLYLSNRTLARFEERCNGFRALMESRALTSIDRCRIENVVNSYLGFCRNRSTYNKRVKLINSMGAEFWRYFFVRGHYETIRIRPNYRPVNINL